MAFEVDTRQIWGHNDCTLSEIQCSGQINNGFFFLENDDCILWFLKKFENFCLLVPKIYFLGADVFDKL